MNRHEESESSRQDAHCHNDLPDPFGDYVLHRSRTGIRAVRRQTDNRDPDVGILVSGTEKVGGEDMTNEEAITYLKYFVDHPNPDGSCDKKTEKTAIEVFKMAIKALKERPTGKWIDHWSEDLHKLGYRQCSNCKAGCQIYEHGTRKSDLPWIDGQQFTLERIHKYCPNCGAKMEVKK